MRIVLELHDIKSFVRTLHELGLATASHPTYLFGGSQTRFHAASSQVPSKYYFSITTITELQDIAMFRVVIRVLLRTLALILI